ncbi:hypothetical protein C457_16522 [Haloferax prahovense DSM 18310]|uniref:Uncharacterized protein n=2 Tax=Haloferax TaxID=2251 RepID=A0A871BJK1_HALGI|nr:MULTISPECIES: hypothetical protein [Haloferax]ELZ65124.1 hypothetical protein C457_16522 [Haloferax prahovense DSM 18310]QOS12904.1 uncharacterized protein HfgLR_13880 [Haloferax gibbonsii]
MVNLQGLRRPEYTGENRCFPCTVVNAVIAVVASVVVSLVSPIVGVAMFAASGAAIYYRGYLVPGTPQLTKRFLPEPVLAAFGKRPPAPTSTEGEAPDEAFDPLAELAASGIVTDTEDGTDVRLTAEFSEKRAAASVGDDREALESVFRRVFDDVSVSFGDERPGLVGPKRNHVTRWPSVTAAVADAKSAAALERTVDGFASFEPARKAKLLQSVRVLLERCAVCRTPLQFDRVERETCCQTYDAVEFSCPECEETMFEMTADAVGQAEV